MRKFVDRQNQFFALIKREDKSNTRLAVFVHGFGGTYLSTWGDLASCLYERSDGDEPFEDWDYLFFGYETPTAPSLLSVSRRLSSLIRDACEGQGPFENNYDKFALFGHSLGTLAIRQLLCCTIDHPRGFTSMLHSIVLFGTPIDGSWLAKWGHWSMIKDILKQPAAILPGSYKLAASLLPGGAMIDMLRTWYETIRTHVYYPRAQIVQGSNDFVLGYDSALKWSQDRRLEISSDHISMVKAKASSCSSCMLHDRIKAALK